MQKTDIDFSSIDVFILDEHLILLKKNASRVQILNPLASIIWQFKQSGLSKLKIADEISASFDIPSDQALQDIESIYTQWLLDFATPVEKPPPLKKLASLNKKLTHWQPKESIFPSFPHLNVRINLDSQIVTEKLKRLFLLLTAPQIDSVDLQLDVISNAGSFLIAKDSLVLEQAESESYIALMVLHHVIDFACKHDDWLVILHAAGVSWQGHGIIFPALGGSGKTTLAAALIKHGFDYINDDVIPLLRNTEELTHLPTCLSIKPGSWPLLQSLYPELEALEIFGHQEPRVKYLPPPTTNKLLPSAQAKYIILPNYQPGAIAELEPLSPVLALQAIIEGESLLRLPLHKDDIAALIKWLSPLSCHRLTYDKLEPAANLLRQFCTESHHTE